MSTTGTNLPRFMASQVPWKASSLHLTARFPVQIPPLLTRPFHQSFKPTARARKNPDRLFSSWPSQYSDSPIRTRPAVSRERVDSFSTTRSLYRDHHFDTLKFVQRLKDEGFSEEQSKAMMLVLSDVIEESIQNLTRTMVLREGSSLSSPLNPWLSNLLILWQMPIEVHTLRKWISPSFALSFSPLILAILP